MESWEPTQHLLLGTGKPRKTCVDMAGRRTYIEQYGSANSRTNLPRLASEFYQ